MNQTHQYLVCPPAEAMTALQRRRMERMSRRTRSRGMAAHSACRAATSSPRVVGRCCRALSLLSNSSHRCSMGFRSGDFDAHGSTGIPRFARCCLTMMAVWGVAPSCNNVRCGIVFMTGTNALFITSFR